MKIVTISDNPNLTTGLAKVHRHVIDGLVSAGADVSPCVWYGHTSMEIYQAHKAGVQLPRLYYDSNGKQVEVYAVSREGQNAMIAVFEAISALKPDVVVSLGDYWDFFYMQAVKKQLDFSFKWVFYATIEQDAIPTKWLPLFQYADVMVVPSVFGLNTLAKADIDSVFVPYGTDECFRRPSPERKRALRGARGIKDGDIRVITVGQNTSRKYLPMVLMVANALKGRADYTGNVRFHIQTNVSTMDKSEVYLFDLRELATQLGVEDMVTFPEAHSIFNGAPVQSLLEEYQASDVFLNTSISEGYHLGLVEGMACGLPVVSNATTTAFEHVGAPEAEVKGCFAQGVVGRRGILSQSSVLVFPPDRVTRIMDPYDAASCILGLSASQDMATEMAIQCEKYAQARTWEGMNQSLLPLVMGATKDTTIPVEEL